LHRIGCNVCALMRQRGRGVVLSICPSRQTDLTKALTPQLMVC
jgi:hypothetical protein